MQENKKINYIEFSAPDQNTLNRTTEFYTKVFGWNYKYWGDEYADTSDSGVSSGFNATVDQKNSAPLIVLYTENLEATKAEIAATGVEITVDIFSFPGGRRFHFKDPAGNELGVWSDH
ncbi:MAG: VOC family protein [Deferribacteres bacterium]|nr:VOC family protein [candidate division KSB1 bacterium]MCB9501635.1 VOC family protein [Deferribacteres bacterium]